MHVSSIFACHATVSVSLTLLNKKLVADFPFPWCTVMLQCCLSVPIILAINFRLKEIGPVRMSHLPGAMLVSSLFLACLMSSFFGLKRVHVPMVVVGKNLTPFCTAMLEAFVMRVPLRSSTLAPLLLSISGGAIYAYGDASAESIGIFLVLLNSVIVACTSVSEKKVVSKDEQVPLGWSLYRNALALPMLVACLACGVEDTRAAWDSLAAAGSSFWLLLLISASFSAAAGCLIFMLQARVSATTTQVANLCYKVGTTLLSFVFFPESRHDIGWPACMGYALSTLGIFFYVFPGATKAVSSSKVSALTASTILGAALMWKSSSNAQAVSIDDTCTAGTAGCPPSP